MIKKVWIILTLLGALSLRGEGNLLGEVQKSGVIEVVTDNYRISFFPGHMFFFDLKLSDGTSLPPIRFLDRLVKNKRVYFLWKERFAEIRIIENTPEYLAVETSGNFVYDDDNTAPGKPRAVYRYECRKDSPEIKITAEISCGEVQMWDELVFCMPGWKNTPFDTVGDENGNTSPLYSGQVRSITRKNFASLVADNVEFGIAAPDILIWNNAAGNYYTYIGLPIMKKWNGQPITLEATVIIRPFATGR